ncbi:hypothetical protein TVNIR_0768 [Thioalkalivibrio nitratireducens DSM 14787]|uniref:Uncharacterized protein n=1 Tax=Thioalkalivibrio nitratireducens (strain DSM 14787 / UNIQEM 213 / ALEN2) TaxID=1255043 RepID=L0DVU8_THIND|nr:hypothetical protein TVNIR_0768 [Thioalkalivibrio nitratireducens DSM 14787]
MGKDRADAVGAVGSSGWCPLLFDEFTHTKRSPADILENTRLVGRPLRMATPQAAWRDLKRVGRNTHLVDARALADD